MCVAVCVRVLGAVRGTRTSPRLFPTMARRKSSWAQGPQPDQNLAVDIATGSTAQNGRSSSLAYPLTYIVTPSEARSIQVWGSKLGVVPPPPPSSACSTEPTTPWSSHPNTPNGGLPPRSPFVPLSNIHPLEEGPPSSKPTEKIAYPSAQNALHNILKDEALPVTSRHTLRSFAAGYTIHTLLNVLLPILARRKSPRQALGALVSAGGARIASALALYTFFYRGFHYWLSFLRLKVLASLPEIAPTPLTDASHRSRALSRLVRLLRGNGIVPFLSSLVASPALLLLPSQSATSGVTFPRKTFALDLFTKGLHAHFQVLKRRRSSLVTWLPEWCDLALLYAISQGQLLYAFLFEPDCFPKSYGDFILRRSSAYVQPRPNGLPESISWPSHRQIADHVALMSTPTPTSAPFPAFSSASLSSLRSSGVPSSSPYSVINPILDWSPAHPSHSRLMCAMLHPNEPSCKVNYLNFWSSEWKQSAKFVALITAVFNVFKWRSWKRDPEGSLFRFAMSVAQGATVISGNIAAAWGESMGRRRHSSADTFHRLHLLVPGIFATLVHAALAILFQRLLLLHLHFGRARRPPCPAGPVCGAFVHGQHLADSCQKAQSPLL